MDRQLFAKHEQVIVTRYKQGIRRRSEHEQVVVPRVHRAREGWSIRIGHRGRRAAQMVDDCFGDFDRYPTAEFRVGERALEFAQEERRDDQLESALLPGA